MLRKFQMEIEMLRKQLEGWIFQWEENEKWMTISEEDRDDDAENEEAFEQRMKGLEQDIGKRNIFDNV